LTVLLYLTVGNVNDGVAGGEAVGVGEESWSNGKGEYKGHQQGGGVLLVGRNSARTTFTFLTPGE